MEDTPCGRCQRLGLAWSHVGRARERDKAKKGWACTAALSPPSSSGDEKGGRETRISMSRVETKMGTGPGLALFSEADAFLGTAKAPEDQFDAVGGERRNKGGPDGPFASIARLLHIAQDEWPARVKLWQSRLLERSEKPWAVRRIVSPS